jgi:hypothetical protein
VDVAVRPRNDPFIVVHRPQHPAFFAGAPYNVAIVELEEGIRRHTNVVTGCAICRDGRVKRGAGKWRRFGTTALFTTGARAACSTTRRRSRPG